MTIRIQSEPIPVPPREEVDHCRDVTDDYDDETANHEAQMYEAATWRMYQLISTRRRALAAANLYHYKLDPQQHRVLMTPQENNNATITSSQQQQQQQQQRDDTRRDRVHSLSKPEPPAAPRRCSSLILDGVFVMESM
jgi:hypothetical protein